MSPFRDFMNGAATNLAGAATVTQEFVKANVALMAVGTGARINDPSHDTVNPAAGQVVGEIYKGFEIANNNAPMITSTMANVQEKVAPALYHILDEVSKGLDGFRRHHLGPALQATGGTLNKLGEKHIGPAISVSIATLNKFGQKQIIPGLYLTGATLKEVHEKQLRPLIATLSKFSREKLAAAMVEAGKWVQDHPGQTVVIVGMGVILVYPSLVTKPALWVLGFGSEGVGSGESLIFLANLNF
jgi:hypothetical protein